MLLVRQFLLTLNSNQRKYFIEDSNFPAENKLQSNGQKGSELFFFASNRSLLVLHRNNRLCIGLVSVRDADVHRCQVRFSVFGSGGSSADGETNSCNCRHVKLARFWALKFLFFVNKRPMLNLLILCADAGWSFPYKNPIPSLFRLHYLFGRRIKNKTKFGNIILLSWEMNKNLLYWWLKKELIRNYDDGIGLGIGAARAMVLTSGRI